MTDKENSSNNRQDAKRIDLEIDPWLRKRLEERAHPLDTQRLTGGRANLLSSGSQQLLRLGHAGSLLARSLMKHSGLSSIISRAEKLPLLSRVSRNIVKQSMIAESPYTYPILTLPWFSLKQNRGQNDTDEIGSNRAGETTNDAIARSTHTVPRPMSESTKEKTTIKHEKKPETYIKRLISPPITRKTTVDISNRIIGKASEKGQPIQTRPVATVTYPVVPNRLPEMRSTGSSDRGSQIVISKPIIGAKSAPDTGKSKSPKSNNTGSTISKSSEIGNSEKLSIDHTQRKTKGIDRKPKHVSSGPSSNLNEALSSLIKGQQNEPVEVTESPPTGFTTVLDRAPSPGKSDTEKNRPEKEVSQIYPARDLVHRKSISIGKRIMQSLPIIKKISRKDDRTPITPTPDAEKSLKPNNTRLSPKQTEMVHPVGESPGILTESAGLTDFSVVDKTKAENYLVIPGSKELGYESLISETPYPTVLDTSESNVISKRTYQAYPADESIQRKPLPIGQPSMRILPLAHNISREMPGPSEDIISLGAKLLESEAMPVHDIYDNPYLPAPSLPLTSPAITDVRPVAGSGETSVSRQIAVPDNFGRPSNRGLDLTLAPITPTAIKDQPSQQGNYPQTIDVTQYIQRLETTSSSQTATQTSTQQSQPQVTSQESPTKTTENNMNTNTYKPDVKALAQEIYPLIRRMIIIEKERRPSR